MTVLVLATDELKEELLAQSLHPTIQLKWITSPVNFDPNQSIDVCIDLLFENTSKRIDWLKQLKIPLIIINSVVTTLQEIKQPFVRINGWKTFLKRAVVEAAFINTSLQLQTEQLFSLFGKTVQWVPDIAGFITPRVVVAVINEAFFSLEENISTKEEINIAMKLGTNYPFGPFEWAEKIGLQHIYSLLQILSLQKNRYSASLLLKQTALA